jgi:hypothetical protein
MVESRMHGAHVCATVDRDPHWYEVDIECSHCADRCALPCRAGASFYAVQDALLRVSQARLKWWTFSFAAASNGAVAFEKFGSTAGS